MNGYTHRLPLFLGLTCLVGILAIAGFIGPGNSSVSYNTDIRPIFNEHCLRCHGGIKQSGGFSLLFPEDAQDTTDSGIPAIIPGKSHKSELVRRLRHTDPEMRMPQEGEPLSEQQIKTIEKWIDQGAKWEDHWAYIPPDPGLQPPNATFPNWAHNSIDRFTGMYMQKQGLSPNPPASPYDLIRKVSLDITGLPPTQKEVTQFLQDSSEDAYEKYVEQLLTSPHFGERWASMWLDLARYADSKGYEKDLYRSIWKYRDWVVQAFNDDMPFDQFTIEQLAGDLIPHTTQNQLIATAFHRNTMANDEGGTDNEEFRNYALIERVGTTFEVWQGTTMSCVQCHSHPYDPFRHEDFYRFMAYFNNTQDRDIYHEAPNAFTYEIEEAKEVRNLLRWLQGQEGITIPKAPSLHQQKVATLDQFGYRKVEAETFDESSSFIELTAPKQTAIWQIQDTSWVRFDEVDLSNVEAVTIRYVTPYDGWVEVRQGSPLGPMLGKKYLPPTSSQQDRKKWERWENLRININAIEGRHMLYFVFRKNNHQTQDLFRIDWFYFHEKEPLMEQFGAQFRNVLDSLNTLSPIPTPILRELPADKRRPTHVFQRGNWLVKGEEVSEGIPGYFQQSIGLTPNNRLDMAQWLVHPNNPLTARVMVNRFWEQIFGRGLIETTEDLGSQGSSPSHPQLLDWLATEFMYSYGWSVKRLLKEMVMSAMYAQDATVSPEKLFLDPDNRWLSRGTRVRLSAEQMRDQVLAVSGLLNRNMYGPSVRPPLPESVANFSFGDKWVVSETEDQHRRSLYTYVKRTNPFPNRIIFDGTDRTVCTSRRIRTNTPLQALALMNNPAFLEAADSLASYMCKGGNMNPVEGLKLGYERVMLRAIDQDKLGLLSQLFEESWDHYEHKEEGFCEEFPDSGISDPQWAAYRVVANAMLNLDEFITK